MFTALYYPHITISHDLVKNSLFLWDRLEYIVPESACDPTYEDESLRDAVHTIAVPHVPSPESRRAAEKAIFEVIQLPLPTGSSSRTSLKSNAIRYTWESWVLRPAQC